MNAVQMVGECMKYQGALDAVERESLLRQAGCVAVTDYTVLRLEHRGEHLAEPQSG